MNDNDLTQEILDEAHTNNRINGLPAKAPTEIRRRQADGTVAVWTSMTPEGAKAWADDMIDAIRQMSFAAEIDSWEQEQDRSLSLLSKYYPDEYERICEELWTSRENVNTLRW
jgi:hypothetical protein